MARNSPLNLSLYLLETLHLLKSGSKQSTGERKRKKYDLLGDYTAYKESKR